MDEQAPPGEQAEENTLELQLEEYKQKYLLSLAEMENTRKRLQKEKHEMTKFAVESALVDFLGPLDQLENALRFTEGLSPEVKNWAMGFQMIAAQFHNVLSEHGIISFASHGKLFDPHRHEAIEVEETLEIAEGTITKEFIKGYLCGERTLRPARVKVARKPKQEEEQGAHHE